MRRIAVYIIVAALGAMEASPGLTRKALILNSLEEAAAGQGGPVLLVFFSTSCAVCYEDLFEMRYFVEASGLPVRIVGIAAGAREDLEAFLAKYGFEGPVIHDPKRKVHRAFRVDLVPDRIVWKDGRILFRDDGRKDFSERREEIKKWLWRYDWGR